MEWERSERDEGEEAGSRGGLMAAWKDERTDGRWLDGWLDGVLERHVPNRRPSDMRVRLM